MNAPTLTREDLRTELGALLTELAPERLISAMVTATARGLVIDGERFEPRAGGRLRVVAIGKAAPGMARGLREVFGAPFGGGLIVSPALADGAAAEVDGFEFIAGGHPVPDHRSLQAGRRVEEFIASAGPDDGIVFLISGGGSALVERPLDPSITPDELAAFGRALVESGPTIEEMNTVRKHFSALKGGRLARLAGDRPQLTLELSDVPPDRPDLIASGPTRPDPSTWSDVDAIVARHPLVLPASYERLLRSRVRPETPTADDPCFARARHHVLADSSRLQESWIRRLGARGIRALTVVLADSCGVAEAAEAMTSALERAAVGVRAVVSTGELVSPVRGDGVGGRNLAFGLELAPRIAGRSWLGASVGTDGIDGNSPAAGAFVSGDTMARGTALGLSIEDCRRRSDAYAYFRALGDTIETGATGNNLRDLRMIIAS